MKEAANKITQCGIPILTAVWPQEDLCVLGGGGGAAKSGIKNRIIIMKVENGQLSEPVHELDFGEAFPFKCGNDLISKCAVHPQRSDLVITFGLKAGKHLLLKGSGSDSKVKEAKDSVAGKILGQAEGVICSVTFSKDGELLCLGYEAGPIHVWEWPKMKERIKFRDNEDASQLCDLDLDPNCQVIAATTDAGELELWGVKDGKMIKSLTKPRGYRGAQFAHCRFAPLKQTGLFATMNTMKDGSYILKWEIGPEWIMQLTQRRRFTSEAICSFAINSRGDMLAIGTGGGDILVLTSGGMHALHTLQGAHMVFVTAVSFQPEDTKKTPVKTVGLVSASADHTARVTFVKRRSEMAAWCSTIGPLFLLILLLFLLVTLIQVSRHGVFPTTQSGEL